ncbi:hypothetical protein VQL36_03360 [Chengkuizengella sp. SCS-71B]|uniref:hypothetical protein n=1 Tax=Chengkuizengella sp. SCS-71B TaxID=3115290 RepID=UPI0032C235F9
MIYRALEWVDSDKTELNSRIQASNKFKDYETISSWAQQELNVVTQAGNILGKAVNILIQKQMQQELKQQQWLKDFYKR